MRKKIRHERALSTQCNVYRLNHPVYLYTHVPLPYLRVNTVESRALCFLYRLDSSLFAIARLTATRHLLLANEYHSLIFFHPLFNIIEYPRFNRPDIRFIFNWKKVAVIGKWIKLYLSLQRSLFDDVKFSLKNYKETTRVILRISIEKSLIVIETNRRFE